MKTILKYFFISRIIFVIFAAVVMNLIPLRYGYLGNKFTPEAPYLMWIWSNFDGQHFLNIAANGYRNFDYAFFPLYPALIYLAKLITPLPELYLGILISVTSLILSALVIYKIVLLDYNKKIANLTLLVLFFIPLGFFHHSVYADSLFLLLSTTSFYFARRKRWFLSGIFGFLTVLTRLSGLALIPALIVEWYVSYRKKLPPLPIGINILFFLFLGLLIYMLYLSFTTGDPLIFQKAMSAWNQSHLTFPLQVVYRYLKIFFQVDPHTLVYWIAIIEFVSLILYFTLAIYVFKKVRLSYGIFMLTLLSLVPFTGTFAGTPRYILHLFPAFLAIALILNNLKKNKFRLLALLVSLILAAFFTAIFTRGYYLS